MDNIQEAFGPPFFLPGAKDPYSVMAFRPCFPMVNLMAGSKTIYNSTPMECFVELMIREHGAVFDPNFVTTVVQQVTRSTITYRMTGRATSPIGLPGRWRGTKDYRYKKCNLGQVVPTDLSYGGLYPVTAQALFAELSRTYDLQFDDTDLSLVAPQGPVELKNGYVVAIQPNATGALTLRTRDSSQRFIGNQSFNLLITGATATEFQPLTLTGDAPDSTTGVPYNYQYAASGGQAPYVFEIIDGQAPTAIDPQTGRLSGTYLATGALSWVVRVTDARGFTMEMPDSATIGLTALAFQTPATLPPAITSIAYDQPIVVLGGSPPYLYELVDSLPLGLEFTEDTHLKGNPDFGQHPIGIRVTDRVGTVVYRQFNLSVAARPTRDVARSILAKVGAWFEFRHSQYQNNDPIEATFFRGNNPNTLIVRGGDPAAGPNYIRLAGQYLEGQQNFRNDMFVGIGYKSNNSRAGAGIIGRATGQLGWQLYADESNVQRMRFGLTLDSRSYSLLTDEDKPINDGAFTFLAAQRTGESIFTHTNGVLSGQSDGIDKPIDPTTALPMRAGTRTAGLLSDTWNADLYSLMFATQRFWADELNYLYGTGSGRTYSQTVTDAQF